MAIFIALFQPRDFCLRFLACEVSRAPKDYHRTTLRDEGGSKMAAQVDLAMLPKGFGVCTCNCCKVKEMAPRNSN